MHKYQKEKKNKLDFLKMKTLCFKGYHNESDKATMGREKIFVSHNHNSSIQNVLKTLVTQQ